jgi:hypothetical protein
MSRPSTATSATIGALRRFRGGGGWAQPGGAAFNAETPKECGASNVGPASIADRLWPTHGVSLGGCAPHAEPGATSVGWSPQGSAGSVYGSSEPSPDHGGGSGNGPFFLIGGILQAGCCRPP